MSFSPPINRSKLFSNYWMKRTSFIRISNWLELWANRSRSWMYTSRFEMVSSLQQHTPRIRLNPTSFPSNLIIHDILSAVLFKQLWLAHFDIPLHRICSMPNFAISVLLCCIMGKVYNKFSDRLYILCLLQLSFRFYQYILSKISHQTTA